MLDRLDASQKAQRRFLADAAHELRTPLASARAQLDADRATGSNDGRPHGDLSREVDRMQHLVEGLLVLARSDLHALTPQLRLVDADDAVQAAVARASLRHDVPVSIGHLTPVQVRVDPRMLEQVLDNLLDNAERHAVRRVTVCVTRSGDHALLHVEDDGPGIAPDQRDAAFERFTRLDAGRARTEGGAGLGLAIVRDLVAAHGGEVDISTSALGGARFTVRLPAAQEAAP
jgi:signal transduction histidine kinase